MLHGGERRADDAQRLLLAGVQNDLFGLRGGRHEQAQKQETEILH
jgi:hypothetical protein